MDSSGFRQIGEKMRRVYFLMFLILASVGTYGQSLSVDAMAGSRNYWYQHVLSQPIQSSDWGFFNVSSLNGFGQAQKDELMSQSYITYSVIKGIKLGAGTFYSTVPGFKASANIQLLLKGKNYTVIVIPRIDVNSYPSYDCMSQIEYVPSLTNKIKLYTRIQTLFNYTQLQHNRSYQYVRLGIDYKQTQLGLALNNDVYGSKKISFLNIGVFVRKDLR